MADRLFGVFGNECLEFALCPLVIEKGAAGAAEQRGKLRPGIRGAHVDDADRLDTRSRRLGVNDVGSFAGLDAPPEFFLRRNKDTQIERVHGDRDLDPLAAAGDDQQHRGPQMGDPHVVLDLGHVLLGRGLLGERPGQHKLRFEYGFGSVYDPVEGCRHPRDCRVLDEALYVADAPSRVALVPAAVKLLGSGPQLHDQIARAVLRLSLTAFLAPEAYQSRFIAAHDDPSIRSADEPATIEVTVYLLVNPHCNLLFPTGVSRSAE